jgi:cytidine deaminase
MNCGAVGRGARMVKMGKANKILVGNSVGNESPDRILCAEGTAIFVNIPQEPDGFDTRLVTVRY